jgi:hypothetical protein
MLHRRGCFRAGAGAVPVPVVRERPLGRPGPAGNTLASPDAVVPSHGTLRGSSGAFTYQVPANSLTVMRVAR